MGHVARMPDKRPVKARLYGELEEGSKRVGCPLLKYKERFVHLEGHPQARGALNTWREIAGDRTAWRRLTCDICEKIENDRRNNNF